MGRTHIGVCVSEYFRCVIVYITITPESGSERFRIVCIWVVPIGKLNKTKNKQILNAIKT